MGTTLGSTVRTVADIVQVLTKCTKAQADVAEEKLCKDPKSLKILLAACGLGKASVGYGGLLVVTGAATGASTVLPGLVLGGAGLITARNYCYAFVEKGTEIGDITQ